MESRENSRRRARSEISRAPFGFTRAPGGTLAPHAEQASIVAEAFAIGARDGLHAAADYLADALPERRWTTTTTRRLLSNRTYLGEVRYGDQVKADAHEPLVSLGTFTLAQSQPNGQRRPAAAYPLSGLARCRTCGSTMVGARTGKSQRGYRCGRDSGSKRAGVKRCPRPAMVLADSLDAYVKGAAVILSDRDSTHGRGASVGGDSSDALAVAERAMTAAEGELIAFTSDATARQKMGDRAWSAGLDARARARDEAHAAYAAELKRSRPRRFIPSVAILAMPPKTWRGCSATSSEP